MTTLVENLNSIASELRSARPEKGRIDMFLDSLKKEWIPSVISSIVANIITKVAFA